MKSVIAIITGSVFIFVISLIMQVAFLFIAIGYSDLAKNYPFLNDISGSFRYLIGLPLITLIMFVGGIITARLAKTNVLIHCGIMGIISVVIMMAPLLGNADLTLIGGIVSVLSFVGAIAGGWYWAKKGNT